MATFRIDATKRLHPAISLRPTSPRPVHVIRPRPTEDARSGDLFRGLLYGLPIGLTMWSLLALLVWAVS